MSKVLILGATGNLCGLTAERLYRIAPESLRLATSRETGIDELCARFPKAEVVQANWYDESSLVAAMQGVSKVLVVTPDFVTDESIVTPNIINAAKTVGSIELLVRNLGMPPDLTVDQVSPESLATACGANLHVIAKPLLEASGLPVCYVNIPAWYMSNLAFIAAEVKERKRVAMPLEMDGKRMWVSEYDIADVLAKVLIEPSASHVGKEHRLTAGQRNDFKDIAGIFSEVLGEQVQLVDDDTTLRHVMGEGYEVFRTYIKHEAPGYYQVADNGVIAKLLGRPQQTLRDYIVAARPMFS